LDHKVLQAETVKMESQDLKDQKESQAQRVIKVQQVKMV
jgi:hypothetical protein